MRLRIFVEVAQQTVARRRVEIEVVLLHVFAAVALWAGQSESALFEEGVAAVPQREGEAQALLLVADAAEAVFAPAIGARARLIMREVAPCIAVRTVILAHGSPGAFGQIGAP